MNSRERFNATMHYMERDRCPIFDFGFWKETLIVWRDYGYPEGADRNEFFGMDEWLVVPVETCIFPCFEEKILEDKGDIEIAINNDGVTVERAKFLGSIPRHLDHTLKDRASWEKEFKWRFDGKASKRYPKDWEKKLAEYAATSFEHPLGVNGGSLFGRIRDWMGIEGVSFIVYDDRKLFEEMVETLATCVIDSIAKVFEDNVRIDYAVMWEDMCYRKGPILSPKIFREVMIPHYKRITSFLKKHGVDIVMLDCDGDISQLVSLWLEAGVNTLYPMEVGTW
ncbi:MAG: uroporphyrinogen decarboxylase family protein, partial [Planctomycetota bacterium]